jgi:hypothetical protein
LQVGLQRLISLQYRLFFAELSLGLQQSDVDLRFTLMLARNANAVE